MSHADGVIQASFISKFNTVLQLALLASELDLVSHASLCNFHLRCHGRIRFPTNTSDVYGQFSLNAKHSLITLVFQVPMLSYATATTTWMSLIGYVYTPGIKDESFGNQKHKDGSLEN